MKYQLEQPQTDLEPQIKKLFSFVLETSEQANLAAPRTLVIGIYISFLAIIALFLLIF